MTDRIVFYSVIAFIIAGLFYEWAYWIGRTEEAREIAKQAAQNASNADGRTAACLSGTLRLIWKDGSVTRSQPATHYERMLLKSEIEAL